MKSEEINSLGSLLANFNSINRRTCSFGLFICNLLCLILEGKDSRTKKGLTVYSELGTGSCFTFYLKCDSISEEEDCSGKKSSSDYLFSSFKLKNSLASSSEEISNKFSSSLKEIFPSSILSEREGTKNILSKMMMKEKKNSIKLGILCPSSDDIISRSSILVRNPGVEIKRLSTKLSRNAEIPSSHDRVSEINMAMNSSVRSGIEKCKCIKVLIVDDVAFNIEVCQKLLKKMNLESDSAYNGLEAMQKIQNLLTSNFIIKKENSSEFEEKKERKFCENCKFYKIILMDIDMPIKDGIEATQDILENLRKVGLSVSIIGISAFDQDMVKVKAMSAGMKEYVTKPITFKKMNEIINKYI